MFDLCLAGCAFGFKMSNISVPWLYPWDMCELTDWQSTDQYRILLYRYQVLTAWAKPDGPAGTGEVKERNSHSAGQLVKLDIGGAEQEVDSILHPKQTGGVLGEALYSRMREQSPLLEPGLSDNKYECIPKNIFVFGVSIDTIPMGRFVASIKFLYQLPRLNVSFNFMFLWFSSLCSFTLSRDPISPLLLVCQ